MGKEIQPWPSELQPGPARIVGWLLTLRLTDTLAIGSLLC